MRIKKTVWTFFMLIMAATLVLIINSRVQLTSEVVVGGADSVFVKTNALTDPSTKTQAKRLLKNTRILSSRRSP